MRLFVECAFPHLGKRGGTSRKGAVWVGASRKSAFCGRHPHGKAHSGGDTSRKGAVWLVWGSQSALFRDTLTKKRSLATGAKADCAFR